MRAGIWYAADSLLFRQTDAHISHTRHDLPFHTVDYGDMNRITLIQYDVIDRDGVLEETYSSTSDITTFVNERAYLRVIFLSAFWKDGLDDLHRQRLEREGRINAQPQLFMVSATFADRRDEEIYGVNSLPARFRYMLIMAVYLLVITGTA